MSFRENLIHLRAANNMTQEQLAMMLGVSRQSVTKWESEKSYPEMDKLLKMCQVFGCTLDDLVQGDLTVEEVRPINGMGNPDKAADVFDYDAHMTSFGRRVSLGCVAPIIGAAFGMVFFGLGPEDGSGLSLLPQNIAIALGCLCVFIGVAACLMFLIPAGMEHSNFVKAHPYIEDFYTEQQKDRARKTFTYELVGGIVVIFIGICVMLLFQDTVYEAVVGISAMLAIIALGVYLIVRGSMTLAKTNISNYNMAASEVKASEDAEKAYAELGQSMELRPVNKADRQIGAICGIIMIVATIAGLVMLFVPQYFTPLFWLAWPIGGMLCGIAALIIKGFVSNGD